MKKKTVELLQKSASAIKRLRSELEEEHVKRAALEEKVEKDKEMQERLFRLAEREAVRHEDIPELLAMLSEMKPEEQELELLSLEKAASLNFLHIGAIEKSAADGSAAEDALTSFILNSIG